MELRGTEFLHAEKIAPIDILVDTCWKSTETIHGCEPIEKVGGVSEVETEM